MIYHCCDQRRRNATAAHPTLNGIDYLEVIDNEAIPKELRQRTLLLYLLKPVPETLTREQVRIEGGARIRDIGCEWVAPAASAPDFLTAEERERYNALPNAERILVVRTDRYGDHSIYTLRLTTSATNAGAPEGFDPRLCELAFSFKVECASDFDCRRMESCPEEVAEGPDINYLAKDYPSLRRLILDRLTQLVPGWRERSGADLGVTLAELVAYVGDHLSYQQDAVATEAYLGTARRRTSLRRHALLVDYHLHNGCNARVWLHLQVTGDFLLPRAETRFYSRLPHVATRLVPDSPEDLAALRMEPVIFEPLHDVSLSPEHNQLYLYTWGESRCCLPKGATAATLRGHYPKLRAGDLLLFEEVLGPLTGEAGDADPHHRHVVRLTFVRAFSRHRGGAEAAIPLTDPLDSTEITEIGWSEDDRLQFPLCLSAVTDLYHGERHLEHVSVARGNMVLADHGYTLPGEEYLGKVPISTLHYFSDREGDRCRKASDLVVPPRFLPRLAKGPLTYRGTVANATLVEGMSLSERVPFAPGGSAASAMTWEIDKALPQITLTGTAQSGSDTWYPVDDLLKNDKQARAFVTEVEHDGSTWLRFGDDHYGRRPEPGMEFTASYRIGNGRAGNVGAEAIAHLVHHDSRIVLVRNPLPARGGRDMEDAATVRRRAPQAFRRQERAVTPDDYAVVVERSAGVQRAAATQRWTGSWHTMFVTVDREGGRAVDGPFAKRLASHVERYRMAGHDTRFDNPLAVPIELALLVCVEDHAFRADVKLGLSQLLGSSRLSDGRRGLFHPDNLSFGQTVYLSTIYAVARQVPGVASVVATCFQQQGRQSQAFLDQGFMALSRLQIPCLYNDANYPERGVLRLDLYGGK